MPPFRSNEDLLALKKAINEVRKKLIGAYAIVAISNKDINKILTNYKSLLW